MEQVTEEHLMDRGSPYSIYYRSLMIDIEFAVPVKNTSFGAILKIGPKNYMIHFSISSWRWDL